MNKLICIVICCLIVAISGFYENTDTGIDGNYSAICGHSYIQPHYDKPPTVRPNE